MENMVSENQINKILYSYFDLVFEDSELKRFVPEYLNDEWIGFRKKVDEKEMTIVSGQIFESSNVWYWNEKVFNNVWDFFGVDINTFGDALRDYINCRYNLNLTYIT